MKILTQAFWKQVASAVTPGSGFNALYPKSDNDWYTLDSSAVEEKLQGVRTVRVVSSANLGATANITGIPTTNFTDGVTVANGDRVLLRHQGAFGNGTGADNGIWVVNSAGAWTRASDANTSAKVADMRVIATEGSSFSGLVYHTAFKATDTLGTTIMSFSPESGRIDTSGIFNLPFQGGIGHTYYDGGNRLLQIWDGFIWSKPKGIQSVSSTAPSNPVTGEIWVDSAATTTGTSTTFPFFKGVPVTASQSVTAGVNIPFTASEDNYAAWSSINNYYVAPLAGLYRISGQIKTDSSTATWYSNLAITINGTVRAYSPNLTAVAWGGVAIDDTFRLAVNDTVSLRVTNNDVLQSDSPAENTWLIVEYVRP